MAVTETTTVGYGSQVKSSFGGMGTGLLMFFGATALLWWNEGRAVKTAKMLEEAQGVAVHVDDVSVVNPSLTGQLIHATAQATTSDVLNDEDFGFSTTAIKLNRDVQYYQYVENSSTTTEDKLGGSQEKTTTYTCEAKWTSTPVNSQEFHGTNATDFKNICPIKFEDANYVAQNVTFGGYTLTPALVSGITGTMPSQVTVSETRIKTWNETLSHSKGAGEYVKVNKNVVYFGKDANAPEIGDVRVTFNQVNPGLVSLLAQVNGNTFEEYKAKNGKTLSVITMGNVSMDRMFEQEEESNEIMLWVLRVVGVMMVCGGLKGIFGLLSTILKVVPALASVLNWGVGLICNVIGFAWSLVVIAIAWIFYRPILAIAILAGVGALVYFFVFRGKQKGAEQPAA